MAPPAVGTGTLRRLGELGTGGHPVLSVYLDLRCERAPSVLARERELDRLLAAMERRGVEAEVGSLYEILCSTGAPAHGTRSLAMFSSAQWSAAALVPLPSRVESMAVLDAQPWLEPLAGMFTPGDRGVAVVGGRTARLFRGTPRTLVEFARTHDGLHGGPRAERLAGQARRVAELLLRAHRRRAFDELVLVAPDEPALAIEAALGGDLRSRLAGLRSPLAGTGDLDLSDASAQEIARALPGREHARPARTAHGEREATLAVR